jgi:class 3 adenylate cyclase/pimeloyl-ACP methyl ester carboxylesterase
VVVFLEIPAHLDLLWADPVYARYAAALAESCRVVRLQRLGVGLSDAIDRVPTLEEQASDIAAVMDAEGISSAVLFGIGFSAMPVVLLAAQAPERAEALVLVDPYPQGWRSERFDWTAGYTAEDADAWNAMVDDGLAHWGEGRTLDWWDPVLAPRNRGTVAMLERCSASPAAAAAVVEAAASADIRQVLPLVRAPTRVLRHPSVAVPESMSRLVAELIPGATFHVLPPSEPHMSVGEAFMPVFDHLFEVVAGRPLSASYDRQLASILFTDVVSSTERVASTGDARWGELLGRHKEQIHRRVEQEGGRLVEMIGDGSMSDFAGPAAAIRAGRLICEDAHVLDIEVRAGVHTGECNRAPGGGMSGLAVHVAARVGSAAGPGEVWVSRTVRDLIGGSGLQMRSCGRHQLKGVSERWELFVVVGEDVAAASVPEEPSPMRATDRLLVATAHRAPGLLRGLNRIDSARRRRSLHYRG